jgi:hypothetical protein
MTRLASFALAMAIITAALLRRAPVAVPMRSPGGVTVTELPAYWCN